MSHMEAEPASESEDDDEARIARAHEPHAAKRRRCVTDAYRLHGRLPESDCTADETDGEGGGEPDHGTSAPLLATARVDNASGEQIDLEQHFHTGTNGTRSQKPGLASEYRDDDGNPVWVCGAHHYVWRDLRLASVSALEFTSAFDVRKMSAADREWRTQRRKRMYGWWRLRFYAWVCAAWGVVKEKAKVSGWPSDWLIQEFEKEVKEGEKEDCKRPRDCKRAPDCSWMQLRPPLEALTLANAVGRHVLVPRTLWPTYPCEECGGHGWLANVVQVYPRTRKPAARVEFTYARDEHGLPYRTETLELSKLQPRQCPPRARRRWQPRLQPGRPVHRFELRPPHPLARSHILVRRSKWGIAALAGAPPPSLPVEPSPLSQRSRRKAEAAFAEYVVANLVPWSAWDPPELTIARWDQHVKELKKAAKVKARRERHHAQSAGPAREPAEAEQSEGGEWCDLHRARVVAACRLADIENLAQGFKAPKGAVALLMKHRARSTRIWKDKDDRPKGAQEEDERPDLTAAERAASKDLQSEREKQERLRGATPIDKRLHDVAIRRKEEDGLRQQLRRLPSGDSAGTIVRLRQLWGCASAPDGRTTKWPAAKVEPKKVSAANRLPLNVGVDDGGVAGDGHLDGGVSTATVSTAADDDPFAPIDKHGYERAAAQYDAAKCAGSAVGNAPLNPEQRDGGRAFLKLAQERRAALLRGQPIERMQAQFEKRAVTLVIGAGGTGKSAMIHCLQEQFAARGCGKLVVTAYTGVAAAPFGGPTLLSLFNMRIDAKNAKRAALVPPALREKLRRKFEEESGVRLADLGGIVIDEVSFNELNLFGHLDARLRALTDSVGVLCGGVPILLCGDNHQKPPPGGTPWYRSMVKNALADGATVAGGTSMAAARGLRVLHAARRVELTRLMRVEKGEEKFVQFLKQMRDTDAERPVSPGLLESLRPLSGEDVRADPQWRFAPIGVMSHIERDTLNFEQLRAFARAFGLPLVKWRMAMVDRIDDKQQRDGLYAAEESLWAYFVEGAPATLTETIKSVRKLVNGSPCILDSLCFQDGNVPAALEQACRTRGFCEVELPEPPLAVNVRVGGARSLPGQPPGTARGSVLWHGVELDDLNGLIAPLCSDAQVIPLLVSPNAETVVLSSSFAAQANIAESVKVRCFQYMLAFAMTDFKLQGRTMPKLVLSVCKRSKPPYMTLAAFYVLVSRVRTLGSLRLLQDDTEGRTSLFGLAHDEYLAAWERGYDEDGWWSDECAKRAVTVRRKARAQAKQKRDEAKKQAEAKKKAEAKQKKAAAKKK